MSELARAVRQITGHTLTDIARLPGGDISGASRIRLDNGEEIVAKQGEHVAAEGRMLEAMAELGALVPQVRGSAGGVLLIDWIDGRGSLSGAAWNSLADSLAALRTTGEDAYGWPEDYALRHVTVRNERTSDWPAFWRDHRLACHLPHLPADLAGRIEHLCSAMADLLPARPAPALVHGDLWGGNVIVDRESTAWLIDPCAFYGDREVDAASLTVFDRPPASFFDRLELEPGWRERQPIYRLWIWLVHVRLFGGAYRSAVERELDALGF